MTTPPRSSTQTPDFSSIRLHRKLSHSNNSDDEHEEQHIGNSTGGSTGTSTNITRSDDFISFPTLADPEVFSDRGVSGIISKTLRKVTMNASKLVENYSSNFESPKSARSNGLENSPSTPKTLGLGLGMGATHPIDTVDATSINFDKSLLPHQYQQDRDHSKNPIKPGSILHGKSSVPNLQGVLSKSEHKSNKKSTGKIGSSQNDIMTNRGRGHGYGSLLRTSRDQMKQPDFLLAQQSLRPTVGISTTPNFKHKLVDNEAMVKNTKSEGLIKDNPSAMPSKDTNAINESSREMSHRIHTLPSDMSKIRKTQPLLSKVTSDNKSLRLSAAQFPTSSYINSSATSSVVNVNASATVEFSERPGETNAAKAKASKGEKALSDVRLREKQSRAKASTLFTNLPNDIEISDDSASDSDTIESLKDDENSKTDSASYENYQRHLNTHRHFNNKNNTNNNQHSSHHHQLLSGNLSSSRNTSQDTSRKTSVNSVKTQYEPGLGFAATVGKSSPIKGEISGKATFTTKMGNSPTITSFQALQSKDHRAIKRKSGNFSTQILDNAKSLINQNIGAVASSASSIVARRKKKKKKPRKISENPLKNGGIPKKYWMNDAYVTDCLNCFKPFTAFRRKHHCRFCGQIFCSDCMLFVSYNQHKDERRNLDKKPTYNDKLRVCKPCYSDVIIYLSDDSSSSSSSASSSILNEDRAEIGMDGSDYAIDEVQSLEKRGNELLVPNHPLARIRSLSTSTHKEGPSLSYENQRSQYDDSMKITDSLSACNSDSPSSHSNSQRIYPDDSIKSNLKQAPRMAIPTTRAGESVEIPIVRSSLSNMSIPRYGSSLKIETLSSNNPLQHSHLNHFNSTLKHHTNIHFQRQLHDLKDSPSSSKAWTTHASKSIIPDVPFSQSYENPSSFIRAPVSRKPSLKSRLRSELQNCSSNLYDKTVECNSDDNESTTSESSEDVDQTRSRIHLNRHLSNHLSRTYSTGEAGAEEEEEEEEEERRRKEREEKDDDEEDEHAMSLYASLHGSFISNKNSHQISNLSYTDYNTVPTLGEFPMIRSFSNRELEYRQGLDSNHDLAKSLSPLSPQRPSSTNWRSKARANASLQRMRSRRQNKTAKNFSKLTPANIRTVSSNSPLSHSNLDTKLTPESSPTMRKASLSRLTSASESDANKQDIVRKNLAREQAQEQLREREDNEMMPVINRQVSSSTVVHHHPSQQDLESSSDYFSFGQNRLNDEHDVFVSGIEKSEKLENSYEATYDTYLLDLLKQSLNDVEVETDFDEWVTTLTKLMGSVSVLQLTDTLDVRQYIKIKRILGGKISSSYVLKGLFMTKDVDSRQMSSALDDPRIAVLMFPVEYLKQREQFISLRIIQAQQAVYISNLVSRLVSLEPDIIVVGDSVTGLAEKMLEESGITVLSNVKPQIVERISRYTGADVFQSVNDLFFKKGNLGTCKKFEVRRFQYGNKVKTFTFFSGTNMSRGFTFCLRGGDNLCLSKIKLVAELLTAPYLNARFEKSFFLNYCLNFNGVGNRKRSLAIFDVIDELQLKYEDSNSSLPQLGDDILNYIETFRDRIISSSPCVQYTLPAPLCNLIEAYKTYAAKFISNDQIQQLESSTLKDNEVLMQLSNENSGLSDIALSSKTDQDKETLRIIKFASNCSLQLLLNEYQSRRRIWTNCLKFPIYQLNPGLHRSIHVLFSSISIKYATPCLGPNIVVIDYYTENDKCIGQFLDQAFRESVHLCQECEEPLLEHYKTYVHGNMKIDLIVEKFDIRTDENGNKNFQGKDQRVMWTYCRECSHSTPIMAMSEDTYCLSLGKFFEMNFYGKNVHCECEHDYFPNYVKCFGYNDLVIRLECSKVDNYEIVIPKKRLEFIANTDIKLKMDSFNSIKSRAELFFESILKRLTRVKLDTFVKDEEKAEDGTKKINELKAKLRKDSQMVFDKLQKQFADIGVTNYLELNGVYKDLQKLGVSWDNEFNDFERRYLPSENEVNKITQFHLRKYLLDRYNNDKDKDLDEVQKSSDEKNGPVREEHEDDESKKTNEKSTNDNDFNASVDQRPTIPSSYSLSAPQIATKSAAASKTRGVESGTLNPIPEFVPRKPRELSDSRRFSDPNLEFKMFPQNSSLYEQSSNISERISKWEQTANDTKNTNSNENFHQNGPNVSNVRSESDTNVLAHRGSDSSLRSVTNVIPSQNKVTHLANFFDKMYYDQISQEFSKQREIEMKKRNRIRAQPIYDSKPIVEIYNKIEDVVGGTNELDLQKEKEKQKEKQEEKQKEKEKDKDKEKDKEKSNAKETSKSRNQRDGDHNQRESIAKAEEKLDTMKQAETPEKQSLLKSLTNFWADRSATLWDPLAYPLESHEHTFADSDVVVREDEPSSLVAFCLSSSDYRQKMKISFDDQKPGPTNSVNASSHELNLKKSMNFDRAKADNMSQSQNQNSNSNSNSNSNLNQNQKQNQKSRNEAAVVDVSSELKAQKLSQIDEESNDQSNAKSLDNNGKSEVPTNQVMKDFKFGFNSNTEKKSLQFAKLEKKFKQRGTPMTSQDTQLETILNQKRSNHLKYQLIDGNTNLSCKIFYCEQFQALRKAYGVDETFIQSLSRCVKWQSSGGKSGSSFLKTLDNRYILKELSKSELESFVSIAPFYFRYIGQSMFNTLTTAIAKIFGFYQVEIKNNATGKLFKMDFLIMENLFYNHNTTRIFDLKGSMRNRHVQQTGKENEVLLDENMIEYIYESPVFVREQSKKLLRGCLFNDTSFLSAMDVMDYSLVIGIDDVSKKLYIGIIDWLRTFTWDKKVENWVKGNNLIGGGKRGKDPTIVTPKQYRTRFREAMERYILEVPDIWYEGSK